MRVDRFDGVTDAQLIELFHAACHKKYEQLDQQLKVSRSGFRGAAQKKDAMSMEIAWRKREGAHPMEQKPSIV